MCFGSESNLVRKNRPSRNKSQPHQRARRLLLEPLEARRVLTFLPAVGYALGDNPQAVVSGDFNGDSRPDLVAANLGSSTVILLRGNANGTFTSGGNFAVGNSPNSIATGDFNSDGKLDVATANSGDLSVLLGNGTGGFAAATSVPRGGARSVAVGDFDADGKLDLAVGSLASQYIPPWGGWGPYGYYGGGGYFSEDQQVSVLLGSGSGTFAAGNTYSIGVSYRYPWEPERVLTIAVADLNGDAKADVITGSDYYYYTVTHFLGNGNGTLQSPRILGFQGSCIAIADFNGDAKLDLAAGFGGVVRVAAGDGLGGFNTPPAMLAGPNVTSLATADVNVDGKLDLVVGSHAAVNVLLGKDGGTLQFTPPLTAATGTGATALVAKDFNGDGRLDVAASDAASDKVSVLLNDGTWTNPSAPSLQISDVSVWEGNVGNTNSTFTVTLSAPYSQNVTFRYATNDNSATSGVDFVAKEGEITILAGQTSAAIQIPVIGDRRVEEQESFLVQLTDPTNAFFADGVAYGTINDDEPRIVIDSISEATEGNTGTKAMNFVVRLSRASDQEVRVNYSTYEGDTEWVYDGYWNVIPPPPATIGSDFQAAAGTLVFAPGDMEETINVLAHGDREAEPSEAFSVNLSDATGAGINWGHGVGWIYDDEPLAYLQGTRITEGNGGTTMAELIVTLTAQSEAAVTVNYATPDWGSAQAGVDFQTTVGTVTFAPGHTSRSIFVPVIGDSLAEYLEYFPVELTGATGAHASSQVYVEIVDDDAQISIDNVSRAEGNSGVTTFTFTVSLSSAATNEVRVDYETAAWGEAQAGSDFASKTGTVVFSPGQTSKTISVSVYGDTRREVDETFYVYLYSVTGNAIISDYEGMGTILNDDTLSTPQITIGDAQIVEGNSGTRLMTFTVTLSSASSQEVRVNYATANGTARTSDSDYTGVSGMLKFAPGQTTKTIAVKVRGDTKKESNESFYLYLSGAKNATIADGTGVGTILNDDGTVAASQSAAAYAAAVDAILSWSTAGSSKLRRR